LLLLSALEQSCLLCQYSEDVAAHLQVVTDVLMRNLKQMIRSAVRHGTRGYRRHLCFFLESLFPWLMRGDHEMLTMHISRAVNLRVRYLYFGVLSFDPVSGCCEMFIDFASG
jgi:hypothetical protein